MDPDDPRIGPVTATARNKGWPFVAHVEFAGMGGEKRNYPGKFKVFLSANPDVPVGFIHMGQLGVAGVSELLEQHPNVFFITTRSNSVTARISNLPWTRMFDGEHLRDEWKALLFAYPDRFVLAFDTVFHFHWENEYVPQVMVWSIALAGLPDGVTHSIAHMNAERRWKLASASLP